MIWSILILVSWAAAGILYLMRNSSDKKLLEFLEANRQELLNGGSCNYGGVEYTKDTLLSRYTHCVSILILTITEKSCLVPADRAFFGKSVSIAITLLGGWWGLPMGPIKTVQSVYKTLTAKKITVYDLYQGTETD